MTGPPVRWCRSRIQDLLLLLFIVALLPLNGCSHQEYAAPQLEPGLPAAEQSLAVERVQEFIRDINAKQYSAASQLMSPALGPTWSSRGLMKLMQSGPFSVLSRSSGWTFDPVQSLRHGQEMVVHAHFLGEDHNTYNTNFSLADAGGKWPIDFILTPVRKDNKVVVGHVHSLQKGSGFHGSK